MEQQLNVVHIRLHLLHHSAAWRTLALAAIVAHLALPLVTEAPEVCGASPADYVSLVCVIVHAADCLLELGWGGLRRHSGGVRSRLLARLLLVLAMAVDWMLQYLTQYTAVGAAVRCIVYTVPLRAALPIVRSRSASAALRKFALSIYANVRRPHSNRRPCVACRRAATPRSERLHERRSCACAWKPRARARACAWQPSVASAWAVANVRRVGGDAGPQRAARHAALRLQRRRRP
eukprot:4407009-Prymnesium_polylepis.1